MQLTPYLAGQSRAAPQKPFPQPPHSKIALSGNPSRRRVGTIRSILHARGRRLAKLLRADGSIVGYDHARTFDSVEIVVHDFDYLATTLRSLLPWCGSLINGSPATGIRRLLHVRRPTACTCRHWLSYEPERPPPKGLRPGPRRAWAATPRPA
jgi:hypothetical protein